MSTRRPTPTPALLEIEGLVELVTLCGYYVLVSFTLNVLDTRCPREQARVLLIAESRGGSCSLTASATTPRGRSAMIVAPALDGSVGEGDIRDRTQRDDDPEDAGRARQVVPSLVPRIRCASTNGAAIVASAAMTAAARCTFRATTRCGGDRAAVVRGAQSSLKKASLRSSRPASESATSHAPRPSSGRNATRRTRSSRRRHTTGHEDDRGGGAWRRGR